MNERIIKMVSSTTCFTNDYFFENVLKEGTEDMNSYPVSVQSINIEWMISTNYGKEFLLQILASENTDIYKIESLQSIIEYLYQTAKSRLLWRLIPVFILQLFAFEATIHMNEYYIGNIVIPIIEDVHYPRLCNNKMNYFEFDPQLLRVNDFENP